MLENFMHRLQTFLLHFGVHFLSKIMIQSGLHSITFLAQRLLTRNASMVGTEVKKVFEFIWSRWKKKYFPLVKVLPSRH